MKRFIKIIVINIICCPVCFATNVFTLHSNGETVNLYRDSECKVLAASIYPYHQEGNAGLILDLVGSTGHSLVVNMGNETLYVKKGSVAASTRNYVGHMIIYREPDVESIEIGRSCKQQIVRIYDYKNDWAHVEVIGDDGKTMFGWISSDMLCGNPYTTCP